MSRIRHLKSKIIFLQETHLTTADFKCVQSRWPGQVIYACYNHYARGVLILIHWTMPLQLVKTGPRRKIHYCPMQYPINRMEPSEHLWSQ